MRNLIVLFLVVMLSSCMQDNATDNLSLAETNIQLYNDATIYQSIIGSRGEEISDAFLIDSAYIVGDWLTLRVNYSGGCNQHSFAAYWSNAWNYSEPPQTHILITHNANQDYCEAWITQELSINLSWLMNGNIENPMILIIQNGSNNQDFIIY